MPFLYIYGVGDQPPSGEEQRKKILMMKDEEIERLKDEVTELKMKRSFHDQSFHDQPI